MNGYDWPAFEDARPPTVLERDGPHAPGIPEHSIAADYIRHAIGDTRQWRNGRWTPKDQKPYPGWRNHFEAGDGPTAEHWEALARDGFAVRGKPGWYSVTPRGFVAVGWEFRYARFGHESGGAHDDRPDGPRLHRLALWRVWGPGPAMIVVGINPSVADHATDDPTIRRCRGFAKREGFGALCMLNLFSVVEKSPGRLRNIVEPLTPDARAVRAHLLGQRPAGAVVVYAWGGPGAKWGAMRRLVDNEVDFGAVKCFGVGKNGMPRHPLYLPGDAALVDFAR